MVFLHLFCLLTKAYQYSLTVCLDYDWAKVRARKEERSTVLATAIHSIKTKSWHLIEKLVFIKSNLHICPERNKQFEGSEEYYQTQSLITPFPPSASSRRVSTSQVYKIKKSNHSEPNYVCCRFSIVILLKYAHFQNKIKKHTESMQT